MTGEEKSFGGALETFKAEAREHLGDLEASLLELEARPGDGDLVARAFRALHTIKGSGAMFGFDEAAAFAHEVEIAFDLVRGGKLAATKALIDLTLAAGDTLGCLLFSGGEELAAARTRRDAIMRAVRKLIPDAAEHGAATAGALKYQPDQALPDGPPVTYLIRFKPRPEVFALGIDPANVIEELRGLGPSAVAERADSPVAGEDAGQSASGISWDVVLTTGGGLAAVRDAFIFVEDIAEVSIEEAGWGWPSDPGAMAALEEAMAQDRDIGASAVRRMLGVSASPIPIDDAAAPANKTAAQEARATVRVGSEKLDALMALVGELVTVQARLAESTAPWGDLGILSDTSAIVQEVAGENFKALSNLHSISEELERITEKIRETSTGIRMVPFGTLHGKFRRLVRDLSAELGKEADLITLGDDTELDKSIIDKLSDPLMHLLRNCIDHGIETPEERARLGKHLRGAVRLEAVHEGPYVVIEVSDNGRGLDARAICERARALGLLGRDAELSDASAYGLIFAPGFSTAQRVTDVSGRGVGMDVVKRGVEAMRGTVGVSSERGRGMRISLRIPLTLAIIDGLLVRVAGDHFVLPLSDVLECIGVRREDVRLGALTGVIEVRGERVPYIDLRRMLDVCGEPSEFQYVVVVKAGGERAGMLVDEVLGGHQTVIKSLGAMHSHLMSISGATILGDGSVALIIDPRRLYDEALGDHERALKIR